MKLKPMTPRAAVKRYLSEKKTYVSDKTIYNYTVALNQFEDYLNSREISDMREIDIETVDSFKVYRLESVLPITARNDLRTIKNFIEYCESYQCVPIGLHELIRPPKVSESDEINDSILPREEATVILEYLEKYEYASLRHVITLILWKTGMRLSGLRALDVEDFDNATPALKLRQREGTPLKRKAKSERNILITEGMSKILTDYINDARPSVKDDVGRNPLIATRYGRAAQSTIARHIYRVTSPCFYTGICPLETIEHPEECSYSTWNKSHGCPLSVSPHALRRGYVTAARNAGQPKDVTSERVNMSGPILDKHYDHGSHDDRLERRRDYIKDI